jgi:hypothetical protein
MKYALERYHELVTVRLSPLSIADGNIDDSKFRECIELSGKEKENIRRQLRRKSLSTKKKKELEVFIQQCQAEIIQLVDVAFAGKSKNMSDRVGYLFDTILKDLEELLTHIEYRYTRYFNLDEKAPASYLLMTQADLRKRISALKRVKSPVFKNDALVNKVFRPLNAFLKLEANVSYRQLMYAKDLVSEMEEWSNDRERQPDLRGFLELLLNMNFNGSGVANFIYQQIIDCINLIPDQNLRLERLAVFLKQCNQAQIKPGVSFRPCLSGLKEQVVDWILEEMDYLREKLRLFSVAPAVQDEVIADEEKLAFDTSVEVLALFARAAKDSGLILDKQMKGMFRNLVKIVRTTKCERPSVNSLLNKSYVANRYAKDEAIRLLHEMINYIRKY